MARMLARKHLDRQWAQPCPSRPLRPSARLKHRFLPARDLYSRGKTHVAKAVRWRLWDQRGKQQPRRLLLDVMSSGAARVSRRMIAWRLARRSGRTSCCYPVLAADAKAALVSNIRCRRWYSYPSPKRIKLGRERSKPAMLKGGRWEHFFLFWRECVKKERRLDNFIDN
mgnify:CR=1 FL=1